MTPQTWAPVLAYEIHGQGIPVIFLHGLTFTREVWAPVVSRLGDGVCAISVDLPGHGATGGPPCSTDEVAVRLAALIAELEVPAPIVVGHSIAASIATKYAAAVAISGIVTVNQSIDIRPTSEMLQRIEAELCEDSFDEIFVPFQISRGLDLIIQPLCDRVRNVQDARREIVLGYWEEFLRLEPAELQERADLIASRVTAPYLAVFGHVVPPTYRDALLSSVPQAQLEIWPGHGHFAHLVDVDRFTARLKAFVRHCREHHAVPGSRSNARGGHAIRTTGLSDMPEA